MTHTLIDPGLCCNSAENNVNVYAFLEMINGVTALEPDSLFIVLSSLISFSHVEMLL